MSIEAIGAVGAVDAVQPLGALGAPAAPVAAPGFADWIAHEVGQVDATLATSENDLRKLATGQVQNLHEVMIHMEGAKLSFQLLAQVRNRLLDAYQEVMRMQV